MHIYFYYNIGYRSIHKLGLMKQNQKKPAILRPGIAVPIILFALLVGVSPTISQTIGNVSPCIDLAGCDLDEGRKGDLTITTHGSPASYYTVRSFQVVDGSRMVSTQPSTPFNPAILVSNVLFWTVLGAGAYYGVLYLKQVIGRKKV